MRKLATFLFAAALMLVEFSPKVHAADCTKDALADQFGDWFGTLGKKEARKARIIATRKKNREAECMEREAKKTAQPSKQSVHSIRG